jgi:hypothetical protein
LRSLHDEQTANHSHAADVRDFAGLVRREIERHRLVERQLLPKVPILDHQLFCASRVGLAGDDEVQRLALLDLDTVRLESPVVTFISMLRAAGAAASSAAIIIAIMSWLLAVVDAEGPVPSR